MVTKNILKLTLACLPTLALASDVDHVFSQARKLFAENGDPAEIARLTKQALTASYASQPVAATPATVQTPAAPAVATPAAPSVSLTERLQQAVKNAANS